MDQTLQLLDGLRDNPSKRMEICKYVEENNLIAVFAYGSLLWNPVKHVDSITFDCTLQGYRKGFLCEDFIYRGMKSVTGLTMGIEEDPNSYIKGGLLVSTGHNIIPFLQAFIEREAPISVNGIKMDIYRYDFVKILMPKGMKDEYALTCIVNEKSAFHLNPKMTLDEQAKKMAIAYGQNGTNLQYLKRALETYKELQLKDSCTDELEELYHKVILCRKNLPTSAQDWLRIYDELQTMEERQRNMKVFALAGCQASLEPHLRRSICIQRLYSQDDTPRSA